MVFINAEVNQKMSIFTLDHKINFELVFKLREKLYTLIEEYLKPNNTSEISLNLKEKLSKENFSFASKIKNETPLETLLKQKSHKALALKDFTCELISNLKYNFLDYTEKLSQRDLEFCKDLLINDLIYYGSITPILALTFKHSQMKEIFIEDSIYKYFEERFVLETIIEIQINNYQEIFIETKKGFQKIEINFISEEQLKTVIERLIHETNSINANNYQVNFSNPILDFDLAFNKLRGSTIFPPASKHHCLTIRIHPEQAYDLNYLEAEGMFNTQIKNFFLACQKAGLNIAIAGTMGTGKTTLLSALTDEWSSQARKAVIEDTPEIQPNTENLIFLKLSDYKNSSDSIDIYKLVKACKRHSIKYVALSEARDGSAWEILQLAQNILGCLMTFHFTVKYSDNEVSKALENLVYLCKLNPNTPSDIEVKQLSTKILDILILIQQDSTNKKRIIKSISHIQGYDPINGGHFKYLELFKYNGYEFNCINKSSELENYFSAKGVDFKF